MSVDIINAVKAAGVVGAGGAGFPTHVKLEAKVDTYIANGAECEPLLRVDQQLMALYPERIIKGLQIGMQVTGASKGFIAIKKKHGQAIEALKKALATMNVKNIDVYQLDDFYPAGDEHVLCYEVTKRLVPESGIPLRAGIVVNNVCTLMNIADAVENKPVITRYVTITGAVKTPQSLQLPIGTSIAKAIELAGGASINSFSVILGGPMMGVVAKSLDVPITKTTSGIIVLPPDHFLIRRKTERMAAKVVITKAACIRCQMCTEVCPRYLLGHNLYPDKVMRAVAYGSEFDKPYWLSSAFLCVFCGACTFYGCPMGLDPCQMNREVRDQLSIEGMKNPHKRSDLKVHQDREYHKIPLKRLIARLNLSSYDLPAPMNTTIPFVERVRIPLKQHTGEPAIPIVKVGDTVKEGQLIGKIPDGCSISATVHASISGLITQITDSISIDAKA